MSLLIDIKWLISYRGIICNIEVVSFAGWKLNQLGHWAEFICIAIDKNHLLHCKLTLPLQCCKVAKSCGPQGVFPSPAESELPGNLCFVLIY